MCRWEKVKTAKLFEGKKLIRKPFLKCFCVDVSRPPKNPITFVSEQITTVDYPLKCYFYD